MGAVSADGLRASALLRIMADFRDFRESSEESRAEIGALERWHNVGRGTLVVLDVVPEADTPSYEQRRALLESLLPTNAVFSGDTSRPVPCGAVVLTPPTSADSRADALAFYQRLRGA